MLDILLAVVGPIFITIGLGWGWTRSGRPFDTGMATTLVTYIGTPALVFSSLVKLTVTPDALAAMGLAALAAFAIFGIVGTVTLRLARLSIPTYLPLIAFPNTGNMGLPLSLFAFGEPGLQLAVVFFTVSIIIMMTLGLWLVSGSASPRPALTTPLPYAAIAAAAFLATETQPPGWLLNTTDLLGQMTIPLMLIALGVSLARMRIVRLGRAAAMASLRLGLGFAVGVGLGEAFGFDPVARGVLIIECAMPVAVFTYLFARLYDREPEEAASAIVLSTLISLVTLPFLMIMILGPATP